MREKFADYVMGTDEAGEPWLDIACAHPQTAVPLWMFAGLAGATLKAINEKNKLRNEKIADLTARLAALEARPPALKWAGPWKPGETYQAGDAVADRGVWICTEPTAMRPGESRAWQLAIKPARDGKDAPR